MKTLLLTITILLSAIPVVKGESKEILIEANQPPAEVRKKPMQIDPKMRALDYLQAYDTFRKEKSADKVCINLVDGTVLKNIIEMKLLENSTIFLLKFNSSSGIKMKAIELELIQGVGYLE